MLAPVERYVFGRRGHPGSNRWSLETWLKWPHAVDRVPAAIHGTVEERLQERGPKRRIELQLINWSGMAPALLWTDMLANRLLLTFADGTDLDDLQAFEPPLPLPRLTCRLV